MEQHDKISGRQKQLLKTGIRLEQFEKTLASSPWVAEFAQGGTTSQVPQDWQIDLGNYCNSACIFCTPRWSSRLATEFKKIGIIEKIYNSGNSIILEIPNHGLSNDEIIYIEDANSFPKINTTFHNSVKIVSNNNIEIKSTIKFTQEGNYAKLYFGDKAQKIRIRYGVSFISEEQAEKNLRREIKHYSITILANEGRKIWNKELGKISIKDNNLKNQTVFYTALYRCLERPVKISEDGNYFSASDGKIHSDGGIPFFTDDWIWDTYRAAHPLRILTDAPNELNIIKSYIRMAEQMNNLWMPTFPEVTGDSRRMNSNHGVAIIADAIAKGLNRFDVQKAFLASKQAIEQKTLAPWSAKPAGVLDSFYQTNGYFPALATGETETVPQVNLGEKRQPIAVTLGTSYDQWCLSQLAKSLGDTASYKLYLKKSYNYRNVFNATTKFFHPKDKNGNFITPFDYNISGGKGAREAYGENNGWIYRWDVQHNIADLIDLMGGKQSFTRALDSMFNEPLGRGKYGFYEILPDHTGNVGQFSMANEPAFHIPYLYNYGGEPWKTQKRIRSLLNIWFRDDLMGMPGDEDGGGMCSFIVFSS
jgi:predicted alpha-1,2-mannosidase